MPKFIPLIFFISLFTIFLLPPTDPDLGWQLRCGELFWQERSFCEHNQFSVLLENYSWPNHHWLYQATIYPIWSAFGRWGLTVFNALLMTAGFGFLFAAIKNHTLEKILGILATIYFGWGVFSFGIRSQLVGFFFFNFTLYLLTKIKIKPLRSRRLEVYPTYFLPLTMLLWANSHGSVVLGLVLITLSYLTTTVVKRERVVLLTAITAISGLVTLINPFGFRIYKEAWRHFAGPLDLSQLIAEWVPPQPQIQQIILVSGGVALLFVLFKSLRNNGLQFALPALLLIPIFTFWALKARRNVPFHFVITSYFLLNSLKAKEGTVQKQLAGLLAVGVLLYSLVVQLPKTIDANASWESYVQSLPVGPPMKAIEFLKNQPEEERGNIFNRYEIGGFLIWQLPEYKIFVDGRMPAWETPSGKSPYTIYLHTLQARPGWQETLETYKIDWILISPGNYLDLLLKPDPQKFGWQEVFRDKIAVVYKKL